MKDEDFEDIEELDFLDDEEFEDEEESYEEFEEPSFVESQSYQKPEFKRKKTDEKKSEKDEISDKQSKNGKPGNNIPKFNKNKDPKTAEALENAKNKNAGNLAKTAGRNLGNKMTGRSEEEKGSVEKKVDDVAGDIGSKIITAASGGSISGPAADFLGEAAAQLAKKQLKNKIIIITVGALGVFLLFVIFITILTGMDDDDSDTIDGTVPYIYGSMTAEELANYLIELGYCDNFEQCTDTNVYKFYEKFKTKYDDFKASCPSAMGDSYLKDGGLPCNITLSPDLIFETLSFGLTDEQFLSTLSFEGTDLNIPDLDRTTVTTTSTDIDNLALAMSEYVHEKCYVPKTVTKCYIEKAVPGAPSYVPKRKVWVSCDTEGAIKVTETIKEAKDQYYFNLSFDKYISYLKFGDTSSHPNIKDKDPVVIGDYENRVCTGPQDSTLLINQLKGGANNDITSISGSGLGVDIINYALQFVGNPYVWGGTSLTNGADCSGFIQSVLAHFNISVPHSSESLRNVGTDVGTDISNALPGDIICYDGHVALYMGNNQIVHAASSETGIKIGNNASYRTILTIRRVV